MNRKHYAEWQAAIGKGLSNGVDKKGALVYFHGMKNILKFFLIAILLILGSGCASIKQKRDQALYKGDYESAGKFAEQIVQNPSSADPNDIFPLCIAHSRTKKYSKLMRCLDNLNAAIERRKGTDELSELKNDLMPRLLLLRAEALLDLGDYTKALEYAKMAYELGPKSVDFGLYGDFSIYSLSTLSIAYTVNGDRANALRYIEMLKEMDIGFRYRHAQPTKYMELAKTYLALHEYKEALNMIEKEKSGLIGITNFAFEAVGGLIGYGAGRLLVIPIAGWGSWNNFQKNFIHYKCLYENADIESAKEGYDNLLENSRIFSYGDLHWTILSDRGRIYQMEGNLKTAIDFYKKSIDVIEEQRSTINTEASKIGFVGNKQKVYHQMVAALYSDGQYMSAFEYVERSKSRALVDLLASKKDFASDKTSALKELEEAELQEKALNISAPPEDKTTDKDKATQIAQTTPQSTQRTVRSVTIKEKIKTEMPELSSLVTVSVSPTAEIQSYIGNDETLIEYYYHADDLYAFVLTKNELKAVKLDGKELISVIEDFRKSLQDSKSSQYLELSQKLHQRLIKPVEQFVHTQKLVIVPHGVLHYLPFNALNSGGNYLIDKYSISYLPSASVMKFLKQRKLQKTESALIIGNPDLDDPKYDLKYAGDEAIAISKEFSKTKVFLRKDATKTNFKKTANQFNYIHFATHGMFESDSPMKSGLFLSKDDKNDGILTVDELYSLQLNADLVTLSACETGLGKVKHGDDVVGLTRGFLYAGANSIVASLWKVDDLATSQLMTGFYSNLKKTNKRDALREAQLEVKKQYEHPYFWAAFQLTGIAD